jgi:hypothetical protein
VFGSNQNSVLGCIDVYIYQSDPPIDPQKATLLRCRRTGIFSAGLRAQASQIRIRGCVLLHSETCPDRLRPRGRWSLACLPSCSVRCHLVVPSLETAGGWTARWMLRAADQPRRAGRAPGSSPLHIPRFPPGCLASHLAVCVFGPSDAYPAAVCTCQHAIDVVGSICAHH